MRYADHLDPKEAGRRVEPRVEPDERAWNRVLRYWFFRADFADRPAYLAVDEETLAAMARESRFDVADATKSLSRVVQYWVSPRAPLGRWVREAARWRRACSESDPPFLSVLAITVLAATIVDNVNDHSYYRRLNALLGLPGNMMPRDFDSDIQQLWSYLNEWLTDVCHGQLGTATASNLGGPTNVGWAQSQTLLRPTDRVKLPLFFTALGAQPGQLVDGHLLVRRLRSWSSGGHALSRRLAAVLGDTRLSELLASALHSELAHWDGTLRDEAGHVALKLLLAFHERSGRLETAVQVPEQLSGTTWQLRSLDARVELGSAGDLQLLGVSVTPQILDGLPLHAGSGGPAVSDPDGIATTRATGLTLVMPRRDVHLLCPDDRLARWVEVPTALLHRPHLVLVRSAVAAAATDVMRRLGDDAQPVRRIQCPTGWAAYRFTPGRFQVIDGPLVVLSPRGNELSALDGGLPISRRRRIYLTVGAPDLVLDLREQSGLVTVDDAEASPDKAGRLRLADVGLPPGGHRVSVGGVHYELTLVDEFADKPFDSTLSFVFNVLCSDGRVVGTVPAGAIAAAGHHGPSDVTVSGAAISVGPSARTFAPKPRSPRSRAGGQHFVLGHPGQVTAVRLHPPRWLQSLPVQLAPHLVDATPALKDVPFPPLWLLRVSRGGVTVSAIHPGQETDSEQAVTDISSDLWSSVLPYIADATADGDDAARWSRWQQAALASGVPPEPGCDELRHAASVGQRTRRREPHSLPPSPRLAHASGTTSQPLDLGPAVAAISRAYRGRLGGAAVGGRSLDHRDDCRRWRLRAALRRTAKMVSASA